MEGGVAVFLTLLIVVGLGIGAFLLFGAGGYARHRQVEGELGHDDEGYRHARGKDAGDGERPEHVRVDDDSKATMNVPPPPPTRAAPPD
jgi:hypothetical protein